jgi:hypothetical protein
MPTPKLLAKNSLNFIKERLTRIVLEQIDITFSMFIDANLLLFENLNHDQIPIFLFIIEFLDGNAIN